MFEPAQSEYLLASGRQTDRKITDHLSQFLNFQFPADRDLKIVFSFFPAFKSQRSQLPFPDFIGHFILYGSTEVRSCIGNSPFFPIFPKPNEDLLYNIHAHVSVPGYRKSSSVEIFPVPVK